MKRARDIGRRHRHALLAACLILWAGAMVATHIPPARVPRLGLSDLLLHALGYFVLAGVFWLTLLAYGVRPWARAAHVFFAATAYAAVDEITQPLVSRNAAWGDWAADVLGAAVALLACEMLALAVRLTKTPPLSDRE